jgi:HPt (histidine-containing phosphotransfer) domain-containing protein
MSQESQLPKTGSTSTTAPPMDLPPDKIDRETLLNLMDRDESLLRELAGLFLADMPRLMAEIQDSVARGDCPRLDEAAHTLKGSIANFGARRASQLAARLEAMGRTKDLQGAPEAFAALEKEIARVSSVLTELAR